MYTLPRRSVDQIPVLTTERLILRASSADDYDPCFAMWQDPTYYRFIGNKPRSSGEIWAQIQNNIGSWGLFGFGYWTIEHRDTGSFVGEAGFKLSRRTEISPPLPMIPEAGWGIAPAFWGKGIVREAMTAAVKWADAQDAAFPAQCIIDDDNIASRRVAEAVGFRLKGAVPYGEAAHINLFQRNIRDV